MPATEIQRTKILTVRVRPWEYRALMDSAREAGMTLSEFTRETMLRVVIARRAESARITR